MANEDKDKWFKITVIALLVLITFFVGSIWCALTCQAGGGMKFCSFKKGGQMICPITGKTLEYKVPGAEIIKDTQAAQ